MNKQHFADAARGHRRTARVRGGVRAAAIALAATSALMVGAHAASAASPQTIVPRTVAVFPTWSWGALTKVCTTNLATSAGRYSKVRVTPISNPGLFDDIYANPGETRCISRSWWGAPIVANNLSSTGAIVRVWTV